MRRFLVVLFMVAMVPSIAAAHHGVASIGVAGLEGPGAPIETSSSATLPEGSFLGYMKLDYATFEKFTDEVDDEGDYNTFWMYGMGYGVKSYLSVYTFAPFYTKKPEDSSFTTSGFADVSLTAVLGFKMDRGLRLVPKSESLDDLEDWHFTLNTGLTLPTGNANLKNADGEIDPGMALGFGGPSYAVGLTATKQFLDRFTGVTEASFITFGEYEYNDGNSVKFGDEIRFNAALTARLLTHAGSQSRLDLNLEGNYLSLGRDESNGEGEDATGGQMVYVVPGIRLYRKSTSIGVGVKVPVWTDLNESDDQQGAEGKESYRLIVSLSTLF